MRHLIFIGMLIASVSAPVIAEARNIFNYENVSWDVRCNEMGKAENWLLNEGLMPGVEFNVQPDNGVSHLMWDDGEGKKWAFTVTVQHPKGPVTCIMAYGIGIKALERPRRASSAR